MATVFTCICAMTLLAVVVLGLEFAAALVARHRAEIAADMGALAGALVVLQGQQRACDRAADLVARNRAVVTECTVHGVDVLLTVSVEVAFGPVGHSAVGRARAGPVAEQTP